MDLFQWFDQLAVSTETSIKGLTFLVAFIAVGWATNWFRSWNPGKVVMAVIVAAVAATLIKNPAILAPSLEQTISLPAPVTSTAQPAAPAALISLPSTATGQPIEGSSPL